MVLKPIIPFEPISTTTIPNGDQWVAQVKWDGVRVLTYFDGEHVRLFNRKINERTFHYPELTDIKEYCTAKSIILDGEIIALGSHGKPSFHEVMRRDGIRRMDKVSHLISRVPITYMIFDVVFYNGKWINKEPFKERDKLLREIIKPFQKVQLVQSQKDSHALFEVVKTHELEGIVIKDLESPYKIDGKDNSWQKLKNYQDLIAVVGGVTLRDGVVNSLLLGLYDEKGKLWYIGHAGTGKLSSLDWRNLTKQIQGMIQKEKPFTNIPQRMKDTIWIKPEITVKVKYMEWTSGRTLRQPSIQAFVNQKPDTLLFQQ